jgi:hypothetical protein
MIVCNYFECIAGFTRIYMFFLFLIKCFWLSVTTLFLITSSYGMELPGGSGQGTGFCSTLEEGQVLVDERMDAGELFSSIDFGIISHVLPQEPEVRIATKQEIINKRDSLLAAMVEWNAQQKAIEYFNSEDPSEKNNIFSNLSKLVSLRTIKNPLVHAVLVHHCLSLNDRCNRNLFESLRHCKEDAYLPGDRKKKSLIDLPTIYKEAMNDAYINPVQLVQYSIEYGLWHECCEYFYDHSNGRVRLGKKSLYTDEMKQLLFDKHKMTLLGCMYLLHSAYDDVIRLCMQTKTVVKLLEKEPTITQQFLYKRFLKIMQQANSVDKQKKACSLLLHLLMESNPCFEADTLFTKMITETALFDNNDPLIAVAFGILYAKAIMSNPKINFGDGILDPLIANFLKILSKCTNVHKREDTVWKLLKPYVVNVSNEYRKLINLDFLWEESDLNVVISYLRPFIMLQAILVNWHCFQEVTDNIIDIAVALRIKKSNINDEGVASTIDLYNTDVCRLFNLMPKTFKDVGSQINDVCNDLNSLIGIVQKHLMHDDDKSSYPLLFSALAGLHVVAHGDKKYFISPTELLEMAFKFATPATIQEVSMSRADNFEMLSRYNDAIFEYITVIKREGTEISHNDFSGQAWIKAICLAVKIQDREQVAHIISMKDLSVVERSLFKQSCFIYNLIQLSGISAINGEEAQQEFLYKHVYKMLQWYHTSCVKSVAAILAPPAMETLQELICGIRKKAQLSTYDIDCIALYTWLYIKIIEDMTSSKRSIAQKEKESWKKEIADTFSLSLFMQGCHKRGIRTPLSQMVVASERLNRNLFFGGTSNLDTLKNEIAATLPTLTNVQKTLPPDYLYLVAEINDMIARLSRITFM